MKTFYIPLLASALLAAACGQGAQQFEIDNTKPVTPDNRVIYQMNIGAFTPEGTFAAAGRQLGRLDTLGADILWLMPIYPRGHKMNSPYASMDFTKVNPAYGTADDLKRFVGEAHRRIDSCGFDYDYAWDFQGELARKFNDSDNADSLRAICDRLLAASAKVKNKRMVYLTNHDQNYNDGGNTLKDFYGDNRYLLTVLEFTFHGMPLIYQGQEIGDPDTLNYFTDAKVKWHLADRKMLNTVRTLVALHHTFASLSAAAPVEYIETAGSQVLAYRRGPVVVALNIGREPASVQLSGIEPGPYQQWLDSSTIGSGPAMADVVLTPQSAIRLQGKGYAVYVKKQ